MNVLLLIITICSCILGNSVKNRFAKNQLKNQSDNLLYNLAGNALSILILLCFGGISTTHPVTILLAAVFGLANLLSGLTYTTSLKNGPMSLTALIVLGGSLIVSTVVGTAAFGESVTTLQIIGIVLILVSMVLSSDTKVETNITAAWIVIVLISAAFNGSLGIIQKIQTKSAFPDEKFPFLFWTFIFSTVFNLIWLVLSKNTGKKEPVTISLRGKLLIAALVVGATTAAQHIINLLLVARMPAAVFFPICSGARIILSALVDMVVFKEKLSKKQVVSFILGFFAVMMIAGVFG